MATERFICVKNFEKFQHYKEPNPVWIKFYVSVLDDTEITRLSDAAQAQLFRFWLLASRHNNRIPYDLRHLKQQIKPSGKLYLDELMSRGFLYAIEEESREGLDESSSLARADAGSRKRLEVRGERLEQTTASTTACEMAVEAFLTEVPDAQREGWRCTIAGWEQGLGYPQGKAPHPDDIAVGLTEYLAGVEAKSFSPKHVVAFVFGAQERRLQGPRTPKATRGKSFLEVA